MPEYRGVRCCSTQSLGGKLWRERRKLEINEWYSRNLSFSTGKVFFTNQLFMGTNNISTFLWGITFFS